MKLLRLVVIVCSFAVLTGRGLASGSGAVAYLPMVMKNVGPGNVTGTVYDAYAAEENSQAPLPGARVCYGSRCAITDANGQYTLTGIYAGLRSLTASLQDYFPVTSTVTVLTGQTVTLNFALSSSDLGSGNVNYYRVVVTWDPTAEFCGVVNGRPECRDNNIDNYLWVRGGGGYSEIVNWENRGNNIGVPYVLLVSDYRRGFGPEALDINTEPVDYRYDLIVFNETYLNDPVTPHISNLDVTVRIYGVGGLMKEYHVPPLSDPNQIDRDAWYVFQMDQNGVITDTNCFVYFNTGPTPPPCP